jgi:DNA-binding response OmpR family regulator
MRLLVIEDEEKLAQSLKRGLEQEGYAVDYVTDFEMAKVRVSTYVDEYDLVILDLMLGDRDGLEICRYLRGRGISLPILVLTARDTVEERVLGLDSGADDYMVKPFSFPELVARIRTLLRRPVRSLPSEIKIGTITLNPVTRTVRKGSREVILTNKEFAILEFFMRNPGQVLNREQIVSHIWDFEYDSFSNIVDVHIKNLRKKLEANRHEKIFETVRGVGYRFTLHS